MGSVRKVLKILLLALLVTPIGATIHAAPVSGDEVLLFWTRGSDGNRCNGSGAITLKKFTDMIENGLKKSGNIPDAKCTVSKTKIPEILHIQCPAGKGQLRLREINDDFVAGISTCHRLEREEQEHPEKFR